MNIYLTVKIDAHTGELTSSFNIVISVSQKIYPIYSYGICELNPNTSYHPDYPEYEDSYALTNNSVTMWKENHEYDTQFGTAICHSVLACKLGFKDESGFHEFKDYKIYNDLNLTTEIHFSSASSFALNSVTGSEIEFYWEGSGNNKTAKVFIVVNDPGYEGTYTGLCYKYNYL